MTDLESQLRSCLSRHADDASADPDVAITVADRSRQLARRRPALAVAAAVPIIAAIVVGAVVLGSSPTAAPKSVRVEPAASVTTTPTPVKPKPKPTALPHASLSVCPTGKVPNVRIVTSPKPLGPSLNTVHGKQERAVGLVKQYAVKGAPSSPTSDIYLIVIAVGRHGRAWQVLTQDSAGKKTTSYAKFLGCVREP